MSTVASSSQLHYSKHAMSATGSYLDEHPVYGGPYMFSRME